MPKRATGLELDCNWGYQKKKKKPVTEVIQAEPSFKLKSSIVHLIYKDPEASIVFTWIGLNHMITIVAWITLSFCVCVCESLLVRDGNGAG